MATARRHRSASGQRQTDVEAMSRSVGVGADLVCELDELLRIGAIDARKVDDEIGGDAEAAL